MGHHLASTECSEEWIHSLTDRSGTRRCRQDNGIHGHNDISVQYTFHRHIW